jgi:hypothetical protein
MTEFQSLITDLPRSLKGLPEYRQALLLYWTRRHRPICERFSIKFLATFFAWLRHNWREGTAFTHY